MNRKKRNITLLSAVIIMLIAAVSYEQSFYDELSNTTISRQAQRYISSKSRAIDKYIQVLSDALNAGENLWDLPISNNYIVFVNAGAKPVYWNSNRISSDHIPFSAELACHRIDNAWFLYQSAVAANQRIDVLVNIKNDYSISNNYFDNEDIGLSELSQYSISERPQLGYNAVYSNHNKPLFYFAKTELNKHNKQQSLFGTLMYLMFFLFVLIFFNNWHRLQLINLLSVIVFGSLSILIIRYYSFIPIIERSPLFDADLYHNTGLMNNLGMLALGAIFALVLSLNLKELLKEKPLNQLESSASFLLLIVLFYIIIQNYIFIINHTQANLQIFRIRLLSKETFWIYAILLCYIGAWGLLTTSIINSSKHLKRFYLYPLSAVLIASPLLIKYPIAVSAALVYIFISYLQQNNKRAQYAMLHLLTSSMLLAGVISIITESQTLRKERIEKQAIINTLPSTLLQERDFEVEERLSDLWSEMKEDITLMNMPMMVFSSTEYYANYLKSNYFNKYLKDYDLQVVICNPDNYLQIEGLNKSPNCYSYFESMLEQMGERIANTGFYWQKNNNGRVSYFGWLKIAGNSLTETSIFIDLESQILPEGQGYPEMMRDNSDTKYNIPAHYSFARYVNGQLISSSGSYRYSPNDNWIPDLTQKAFHFDFDKSTHMVYTLSEQSSIVLSEAKRSILSPVYAFIYTFLLFYLTFLAAYLLMHRFKIKLQRSISNDIRITIYGVLLLSLIFVGTASVLFPLNIYKQNQENMIREKSESFLYSISRDLSGVNHIHNVSQAALQNMLSGLSNTLYKDVHIYDLDGKLYASSRPQLFNKKLQGHLMHPIAFKALHHDNLMDLVQVESIGDNEYTSSYFLISNASEEALAYINIPFFNAQQDLNKSIYDYLVLLLNIYLLLIILVIILTYFSVTTITKPLLFIQEGLEQMKLGSNEKIDYQRDDEIGHLVDKYNIMVDELNASVQQLARSEREVAWQRMARQIAHEIKNPLTPMKLSIQHLARTKTASPERFDEFFNKTAHTLIEQIDNLSNIATSFSTFAKISDGTPELFNLNERLDKVITLFKQSGNNIHFEESPEAIPILIDKDHFIQIFNNLIKNAIQAVPDNRSAEISISIQKEAEKVNILVCDNGCGIDKAMEDKIFQPNFTTKNSGMGLGLAISQKMANNAGGEISFKNNPEDGTTFIVNLPISNKNYEE